MACLATALLLSPACAWAQAKFAISAYKVQGNSLLNARQVDELTQAYTGPQSDFETIQRAIESLEKAYVAAGYGSVKVEIPEQELVSGVVTLQVVEGILGKVVVEPHPIYNEDNVLRSLPALLAGQTVNTGELNRNLVLANDSGSKVTHVTFKRGNNEKDTDVQVKVAGEDPQRWLLLLDNTGNSSTGLYRSGLVYQHNNLFNRDHALSVQLMSSPGYWSQMAVLGLGYRIPLYRLGDAIEFNVSSSNVDSGRVTQAGGGPDLAISGKGNIYSAKYTHHLESSAEYSHRATLGLEQHDYGSSVTLIGVGGGSLVPDLSTRPLILGYSGNWRDAQRDFFFGLQWLNNLPGSQNGSTADFNQPGGRAGADAQFQTLKINASHTERFASQWALRLNLTGQYTKDLLIAAEQFGVGGSDSVRGFAEREIAGDRGLRTSFEVLAPQHDVANWRLSPLAFVDAAVATRNQPAPGEIGEQTIASAGLGLRASLGRSLSVKMDWGYVLRGAVLATGSQRGGQKLNLGLIWNFL